MNNNAWFKKENPLLSLHSMGGGAAGSLMQGAASKTYVDDVFSTYVYTGTGSTRSVSNSVDLSTKGGMVWVKNRGTTDNHNLFDTERGATKYLRSNENTGETTDANTLSAFNSDGFSVISETTTNASSNNYSSWTFRKQEGYFDVVSYTGNGTAGRTISHSLGSIPGCIMIKAYSHNGLSWAVGHRSLNSGTDPWDKKLILSSTDAEADDDGIFNDTAPTSTNFTVGNSSSVNTNGVSYVAYLFAGGKGSSDNAVDFDGDDYLSMPVSNSDFDFGASDSLTLEAFVNIDDLAPNGGQGYNSILNRWGGSGNYCWGIDLNNSGNIYFYFLNSSGNIATATSSGNSVSLNKWYHLAVVKDGTTGRFFVNGKACGTFTWNGPSTNSSQPIHVGNLGDSNAYPIDGEISNARITMGQALYTTNFSVPQDPLTQTSQGAVSSNVKLLCCNQSTVTGSTVAPSTISAGGDPTAVTNASIFDDTAANVFGEDEDQNIIKTGSYTGNGSSTGPVMDLGWEPQWILIKEASTGGQPWSIFDSMRGIVTDGGDNYIHPNENSNETTNLERVDLTSTGFKITDSGWINNSGETYIWMAIRRPDGYVGKPPSAGTDVFAMDTGNSNADQAFTSGFPVDWAFYKKPNTTYNWYPHARLTGQKYMQFDNNGAEQTNAWAVWDDNTGWAENTHYDSDFQSWMWKRGQGFDVVTWSGTNSSVVRRHNLGKTPEMIWYKCRSSTRNWRVYHKGLNGGTNPEDYALQLNSNAAEASNTNYMTSTAPTSTTFVSGNDDDTNGSGKTYIALFFASVTGISKVDSYDGDSSNTVTITTGFQPRFLIIKRLDNSQNWWVYDTTRGWAAGDDKGLRLNTDAANYDYDIGAPTSTGFTLNPGISWTCATGGKFIYYAHA